MASKKEPFTKVAQCPVTSKRVAISGILVSLGNQSSMTRKNCSEVANCLEKYGSLEREPNCLLHSLSEK